MSLRRLVAGTIVALTLFICQPASTEASPLYLVQEQAGNDVLLRYDLGILTTVGAIGFGDVRGLAYDVFTSTLYGVSRTSNRLIAINTTTGAGTAVSGNNFLPPGSNTSEIDFDASGALFALGHNSNQTTIDTLYSVNTGTGVASSIGALGGPVLSGLAFDPTNGTLFGTTFGGILYTINPLTGATTLVGAITGSNGGVARIAFDPATGLLFGITSNEQLVTVNLSSLVATQVAQFSQTAQIYSLAFAGTPPVSVPEPSSALLVGFGAVAALVFRRRVRRRAGR